MKVIYEQIYDENPVILAVVDDNLFEEYCKYYFDKI